MVIKTALMPYLTNTHEKILFSIRCWEKQEKIYNEIFVYIHFLLLFWTCSNIGFFYNKFKRKLDVHVNAVISIHHVSSRLRCCINTRRRRRISWVTLSPQLPLSSHSLCLSGALQLPERYLQADIHWVTDECCPSLKPDPSQYDSWSPI